MANLDELNEPKELTLNEQEMIERGRKSLERLIPNCRLIDDYYFSLYAQCYPEDFSMFVSTFLDKDIEIDISTLKYQSTLNLPDSAKDVRFDVSVRTKDGGSVVMEVESRKKFPELRLRYYMSRIDGNLLPKGKEHKYEDLKESYVIIVSPIDMRNQNKPRYFTRTCYTKSLTEIGDDAAIVDNGQAAVYINASYKNKNDNSKLADLIHDFTCRNPDEIRTDIVKEHSKRLKTKGKEYDNMMATAEKIVLRLPLYNGRLLTEEEQMAAKEEGREEGREEGIEQGRREATAKYEAENAKLKAQIAELQQYKKRYDKLEAKFNKKPAAPQR